MPAATSILLGAAIAGSAATVYSNVKKTEATKKANEAATARTNAQIDREKKQQQKQKDDLAARKETERKSNEASKALDYGIMRQKKKQNVGRDSTLLTDGLGDAGAGTTLGGTGKSSNKGKKNLLGL